MAFPSPRSPRNGDPYLIGVPVQHSRSESINPVSTNMAKNLSKDMQANLLNLLETSNTCFYCNDPPEDAVVTICGHVFCHQCVSDNRCPYCESQIGGDAVFSKATLDSCISDDSDDLSSVFQNDYISSKIRATLELIRSHCRSNNSSSGVGDQMCSSSSQSEGPIKVVIFTHWATMLGFVEMSLNQLCIEYRRLDASMSLVSRDKAVKEFNYDAQVVIMLMSLKAGGNVDLNMVAASHVILLDVWWNPAVENEAIYRAHRIGQTRPITVLRITIKDTVEGRILALQEEKRKLHASTFGV